MPKSSLFESVEPTVGLVLNAPAVFARPDFQNWLNRSNVMTWHTRDAEPGEFSDVVVLVDAGTAGSDDDMPGEVWLAICGEVYARYGADLSGAGGQTVTVRLTNLDAS